MKNERKKSSIIVGFLILLSGLIIFLSYLNNRIVDDNTLFTLKENLNVMVYDEVTVSDFIDDIEGKIITDEKINTNLVGTKSVSFLYLNENNKRRRGSFNINIIDEEKPIILLSNSYRVKVNSNVKLEDVIMCADNYDSNPTCKINGEYDLSKKGDYNLEFVAYDSSNNYNSVNFTLTVYDPNEEESLPLNVTTEFKDVLEKYKTGGTEIGIDVSKWQGNVDFKKVKEAGASFVMIRLGYQNGVGGEYEVDPYFKNNITSALENDIRVGVYFYSYADSIKEAKKQASWVTSKIKKYDVGLPVAFDWECYSSFNMMKLSLFGLNEVANAFLKTVKEAGYEVMLYGSKNYLNSVWKYNDYDLWLAHYTQNTDYEYGYVMWQLCQNGVIDGISTNVDIDVLYK